MWGTVSNDGGATWSRRSLATGSDGLPLSCCDPSLAWDSLGNLFLTYLDNDSNNGVVVGVSTDGGASFLSLGTIATGGTDQPSITVGPGAGGVGNSVWVIYRTSTGLIGARGASVTGVGAVGAFGAAQTAPGSSGGNFGDIVVGPNGQVLVTYQSPASGQGPANIYVNLDSDGLGGSGFGQQILVSTTNVGGFDYIPAQAQRSIDAEANLAWDRSGGAFNGRVYLAYTDEIGSESNNTDIFVRRSTDNGATWSAPVRVNDDSGTTSQFFPEIALDQTTGNLALTWYDARNDSSGNNDAQFYGAVSTDGGATFSANVQIGTGFSNSAASSDPNNFGDYTSLDFFNGVFYSAWADNSNSTGDNPPSGSVKPLDIYTARVVVSDSGGGPPSQPVVTITATDGSAGEPSDTGMFTISRTGDTTAALVVDLSVGGSATGGADYTAITSPVTIPASASSTTVTVVPIDDLTAEGNETVVVSVAVSASYQLGAPSGATVTIADNDSVALANDNFANRLTLTGSSASTAASNVGATKETNEPNHAANSGGHSLWWTWTAPAGGTVTISTEGSDFDTLLGVYTGAAVGSLSLVASDDDAVSPRQSRVVFNVISGATYQIAVDGYNGATGNVTLGVSLAGLPTVTLMATDASGAEAGSETGTFTVTRTGSTVAALVVSFTIGGSASNGIDYGTITSPVTIGSGSATATITITPVDDATVEGNETVLVTLSEGASYVVGAQKSATVTIADNDVASGPANDNFANRITIAGASVVTAGSNSDGSKEIGEPNHAGNTGGKSVWWTWTAPGSGPVTITTDGSDFDTTLGIYTGTTVGALTPVASDDDGGSGYQSLVTFDAINGTVYQVAVDGYNGAAGTISLSINAVLSNDNFANRVVLSGATVGDTDNNATATKEAGEPNHAGNTGGHSLWWSWTAPAGGTAVISTAGSDFDTTLGVYTGTAVNSLTTVASNDDFGGTPQSRASFLVTTGTVYQIAVDGFGSATGNITLTITLTAGNDNFANRLSLTGLADDDTANNNGASEETDEPNHAGNAGGRSLWWTWTAPASGSVTISTLGSDFDTILGVYTGGSVGALTTIASSDDFGGTSQSEVAFTAVLGTAYQIAVDGFNADTGNIKLSVILTSNNDNFANRFLLTGASTNTTGDNSTATKEAFEPNHAGDSGGNSLWWTWTAPSSGAVTISTAGSDFDTLLGVYTGTTVGALTTVSSNDDFGGTRQSQVGFSAISGTTYQIAVDGYDGDTGDIALAISLVTNNDDFANRIALVGASASTTGNNTNASKETGEPNHAGRTGGRSLWWTWTAPSTANVTISTADSNFDTLLGVYTGTTVGSLTTVSSNDDFGGTLQSQVSFSATSGTIYQVAVDGYSGSTGNIALSISAASAPTVTIVATDPSAAEAGLDTGTFTLTRTGSTTQPLVVTYSIGGNATPSRVFDYSRIPGSTTIPVNSATAVITVRPIDDATFEGNETVTLTLTSDPSYIVGVPNAATVTVVDNDLAGTPVNDNFDNRFGLSGFSISTAGVNGNATKEIGEPNHAGDTGGSSIWWSWTATATGSVTISTAGSSFDTVLGVYTGSGVNGLTEVASNNDFGGAQSQVTFTAVAGTTYQIAVDGASGATGSVTITLTGSSNNNNFVNRIALAGTSASTAGSNANATKEIGEPNHAGNGGGRSVWWTWTAPSASTVTISTAGSNFDTILAAYTGTNVSALSTIASDDDSGAGLSSELTFNSTSGTTYQIAVDGFDGDSGDIVLTLTTTPILQFGTLQFSSATYSGGETSAGVTITVQRTGGSDGAVTVNYATSNLTATAGSDYVTNNGTLNFSDGELAETFFVSFLDDALAEGSQTIQLTLSSVTGGATLGFPATATLTIVDNELVGGVGTFVDADGDLVTISLKGAGAASVTLDDPDNDGDGAIGQINVTGADLTSSLTIKVKLGLFGNSQVNVGELNVTGSLKGIKATTANFVGAGINATGLIASLAIRDLLDGADIIAGGIATQFSKVTVRSVEPGSNISLGSSIGKLAAAQLNGAIVFSGYTPDNPADPFAGGVFDPLGLIKSAKITGLLGSLFASYTDTLLAASIIGKLSIASVQTNNGSASFGVIADTSIGSVKATTPTFIWDPVLGGDQFLGDFHVKIV